MTNEKQIKEMANDIWYKSDVLLFPQCEELAENLYKQGYRKQSEGEWMFEVNHYFYDYSGDLCVYATAHCGKCGKKYPFNPTVASEIVDRPDNLVGYEDWNIDVEPIKAEVLQKARKNKNLYPFCPHCGAKMKGVDNERKESD